MRNKMRFAGKLAGAGALTALLATAAVAAPAPRNGGQWDSGRNAQQNQQQYSQQDRNRGNRQSAQQLDTRGHGNYGRGQRDNVYGRQVDTRRQSNYGYGYQQQGILRGVVEGINHRYGTMTIREEATGRFVSIDMQRISGRGIWGLRRGEFVTVLGQWEGGNAFAAYQIS
jgi:opacity protein-like surface antigen